jgi:glycine/D-amino acid oxidase-like deaminating enzyme
MNRYMPLANGDMLDSRTCMYTNTPDENFVLGLDPTDPRVVIASPCSGHGFKFSNVVGLICADLALEGTTSFDIDFLSPARFESVASL